MERALGQVPSDDPPFTVSGWVCDLDASDRATLCDNALRCLADIHKADWKALGLDFLDHPEWGEPGIDQQIRMLEALQKRILRGRANPIIDATFDWVRTNRPTEREPLALNWGDARPGNMVFGDDLSVRAVLDWEMASIASPELDLGLWLFLQRHHTQGIGVPLPPGFLDHAATARRYAELTGHLPKHLDYYEIFAGLRAAIIMVWFADSMVAASVLPPDTDMQTNNPVTQLLAAMLGLPPPTGAGTSYIGQRG